MANTDKPRCRPAVLAAVRLAKAGRLRVVTDLPTRHLVGLNCPALPDLRALSQACDLLLVFGGDGTMLRVARESAPAGAPLLGINVGSLGFLTALAANQLGRALPSILAGRFNLEKRSLIHARLNDAPPSQGQLALNEFTISRSTATRLVELDVSVDGQALTRYRCDGLIVSSPTGSTAYSLAAGGPIVTPDAEVFALVPICPHTLSNRPLILNLRSRIQVRVVSTTVRVELAADGQVQTQLEAGDMIHIRRSPRVLHLARPEQTSFFTTLQHKLRWSGSTV